jgi:apoptosis-inducing factor 2
MSGKASQISVVVIGGGAAGITIATTLDKALDPSRHSLTLITQADYLRHHPAALRAVVTAEGNLENDMAIPYDKLFGKDKKGGKGRLSNVKFGKVQSIEENVDGAGGSVVLENNQRVQWDYLAIATGSEWNGPLRWPSRLEEVKPYLDGWRSKFASAKSVVLVGSGAVGTELAGEIRDFIPSAELTVVNRDALPLNSTYPDVFRKRVLEGLTSRGVKYLGGDAVSSLSADILNGTDPVTPERTITTDKGVKVAAELIVSALIVFRASHTHVRMQVPTGGRRGVNTRFLGASNSPSAVTINKSVTSGGYLDVLSTLQLKSNPRVFAAGDVVALPEQHTIIKASSHAPVIAANIQALIRANGKPQKALKQYTKAMDGILITNGRVSRNLLWSLIFELTCFPDTGLDLSRFLHHLWQAYYDG